MTGPLLDDKEVQKGFLLGFVPRPTTSGTLLGGQDAPLDADNCCVSWTVKKKKTSEGVPWTYF